MLTADYPGERLRVGDIEKTLELGKFVVAHCRQMRIGEAAHDQIHLAHASAPGAKQNPPPALVERSASEGGARHQAPFLPRARDVSIRQQEKSFLANPLVQPLVCGAARARAYIGRDPRCQPGRHSEMTGTALEPIDARPGFGIRTQKTTRKWRLKPLKSLKTDSDKGDPPARGQGGSITRISYQRFLNPPLAEAASEAR
jgi:hypothetical protein